MMKVISILDLQFKHLAKDLVFINIIQKIYPNMNIYTQFSYDKFFQNKIKVEVIEEFVVENEIELRKIENICITKYRNDLKLLNVLRSFATKEEKQYKDYNKEWRYEHKEEKKRYDKKYNEEHKAERIKRCKDYYEKKSQEMKEYITCECGKQIKKYAQCKHKQSQFHKDYISNNSL